MSWTKSTDFISLSGLHQGGIRVMYYIIVGLEAIQVGPTSNESPITQRIGMSLAS